MKRFYLYRNLHTKSFSIKYGNKVISHEDTVLVVNAHFKVSETGRQKVLRNKRKSVHATVSAEHIFINPTRSFKVINQVYYDPYKVDAFMIGDKKIDSLPLVLMHNNKVYEVEEA